MKITVLMGGISKERDVSLNSGKAVSAALRQKGHEVQSLDVTGYESFKVLTQFKPDAAFIALHGRFGEDGTVQGILEWMRIPYTGSSVQSSAVCFDKIATKEFIFTEGIICPDHCIYDESQDLEAWIDEFNLSLPVIVKPNSEGSTIGTTRVFKKEDLIPAMHEALKFDHRLLVERYIEGREITVSVHRGRVLPIIEIIPQNGFYDYTAKYTAGKTQYIVPAPIPASDTVRIQEMSATIYSKLGCSGAARVDFILTAKGDPYFLEVNTIPGMTATSLLPKAAACVNLSFEDLCEEIIRDASLKIQ